MKTSKTKTKIPSQKPRKSKAKTTKTQPVKTRSTGRGTVLKRKSASVNAATSPKVMDPPKTRFELWAPEATHVFLAGTFNDWHPESTALDKTKAGKWQIDLPLPSGRYEYLFIVDGQWTFDPASAEHAPNPFGTCNCLKLVA